MYKKVEKAQHNIETYYLNNSNNIQQYEIVHVRKFLKNAAMQAFVWLLLK